MPTYVTQASGGEENRNGLNLYLYPPYYNTNIPANMCFWYNSSIMVRGIAKHLLKCVCGLIHKSYLMPDTINVINSHDWKGHGYWRVDRRFSFDFDNWSYCQRAL